MGNNQSSKTEVPHPHKVISSKQTAARGQDASALMTQAIPPLQQFSPPLRILLNGLGISEAACVLRSSGNSSSTGATSAHSSRGCMATGLAHSMAGKDVDDVQESGCMCMEEALYAPDNGSLPRSGVRVVWDLDFDMDFSMLRDEALRSADGAEVMVSSPVFALPAAQAAAEPTEGSFSGQDARASTWQNSSPLAEGVRGMALSSQEQGSQQEREWHLVPMISGIPADTTSMTYWRLVLSRDASGDVSLSLQRLALDRANTVEPLTYHSEPADAFHSGGKSIKIAQPSTAQRTRTGKPAAQFACTTAPASFTAAPAASVTTAPPSGSAGQQEPESVGLQWHFLVQGIRADGPDEQPVTHLQGSAPSHSFTRSGPQSGILLSIGPHLELPSLDRCHTLRVVAILTAPGTPSQHTATVARPPAAPLPLSLFDRPSGSVFAAPAAAPEEPQMILLSISPRIVLFENFLDPQTCSALMNAASPRLSKSKVSAGTETPSRTSQSTFFTGDSAKLPLIQSVEERMDWAANHPALITGKAPLERTEALQVVSYSPGEFYTEHYDNKAGCVVTRSATIICYLNDCPDGGATYFPKSTGLPTTATLPEGVTAEELADMTGQLHSNPVVSRPGLRVAPARGRAIVFWSSLPNGAEDLASLHSAESVISGEKWIATRWYRELR